MLLGRFDYASKTRAIHAPYRVTAATPGHAHRSSYTCNPSYSPVYKLGYLLSFVFQDETLSRSNALLTCSILKGENPRFVSPSLSISALLSVLLQFKWLAGTSHSICQHDGRFGAPFRPALPKFKSVDSRHSFRVLSGQCGMRRSARSNEVPNLGLRSSVPNRGVSRTTSLVTPK